MIGSNGIEQAVGRVLATGSHMVEEARPTVLDAAKAVSAVEAAVKERTKTVVDVAAKKLSGIVDVERGWYQRATIYELNIPTFRDATGDGIGDLKGVRTKLDYIQDLGIDTVWMLPFNESPMRDGGYDVSNFMKINPKYGTMDDFKALVDDAHGRGMHIITDFPLNHTSIDHPWFQRARRAPKGSPEREFYVWSETDGKFAGTPINFKEFEKSNWTFDPLANQFYWHRWYSHQPDLNWDNPKVVEEMKRVMDYWFKNGVDGLRLDAAPFLVEREGTLSQSLPETHAVLQDLRAWVEQNHPGKMLLAEANEPPEKLIKYFGNGDEMNMAFDFPLMPRMFKSLADEDVRPIADIVKRTNDIPEGASWATFLRNHDELTLEPLLEADRAAMMARYAPDPEARVLGGIRRRLAPLLDNDPKRIELMYSTMLSLPGSPVMYYGDEIGMGDIIKLRDRDGVRTPMQWDATIGAGFSTADPKSFPIPLVNEAKYSQEFVNAQAQMADPNSIRSRLRSLLHIRRDNPVMVDGVYKQLDLPDNKVLAFTRTNSENRMISLSNFSGQSQTLSIPRASLDGGDPHVLSQQGLRLKVDADRIHVTLAPYGHAWLNQRLVT